MSWCGCGHGQDAQDRSPLRNQKLVAETISCLYEGKTQMRLCHPAIKRRLVRFVPRKVGVSPRSAQESKAMEWPYRDGIGEPCKVETLIRPI